MSKKPSNQDWLAWQKKVIREEMQELTERKHHRLITRERGGAVWKA